MTMTELKYELEDLVIKELRTMPGFVARDDTDIVRVKFEGTIDVGQISNALCALLRKHEIP